MGSFNRVRHDGKGNFHTDDEYKGLQIRPFKASQASFADQAEVVAAMKDPRYQTEEGYRLEVQRLLENSDAVELGFEQPYITDQESDAIDIRKEAMLTVFGSDEYKNSAVYRRHVMEVIRNDRSLDAYHQDAGSYQHYELPFTETGPNAPPPPMKPVVPEDEDR